MNHPSFYENGYIHSESSDSSNTTIDLSLYLNPKTIINPKPSSKQLKKIKGPLKKKKKAQKQLKIKKNNLKTIEPTNDISDYLIVGDQFYIGENLEKITKRMISKQRISEKRIMQDDRILHKQKKCICKIQKYIKTFHQNLKLKNLINCMTIYQKKDFYQALKDQFQRQIKVNKIQQLFNEALNKLESMYDKLLLQNPDKKQKLIQWKNNKLHQLNTADLLLQKQINLASFLNFQEQLTFLQKEENIFPEIRYNVKRLKADIANYLQKQRQQREDCDAGIVWVLDKLQDFILQNHENIQELSEKIYQRQHPLLDNHIFIEFEKNIIGHGQDQDEIETFNYIHIFNKAIFDLVNQTAMKILPYIETNQFQQLLRQIFLYVINSNKEEQSEQQQSSQNLLNLSQQMMDNIILQAALDLIKLF